MPSQVEEPAVPQRSMDCQDLLPTDDTIRADVEQKFGVKPCIGQIRIAQAQMERKSDVFYISGTDSGKALTFWIPMIYEQSSITLLITSLNILGQQCKNYIGAGCIYAH
jgi:hypothetical protein